MVCPVYRLYFPTNSSILSTAAFQLSWTSLERATRALSAAFRNALALQVLRQEGDVVVEAVQALAWMVVTRFMTSAESDLGFRRPRRSHRRSRLVYEFHGRWVYAEAIEDGSGSVEGQFPVAIRFWW
jgi:hypothetical protein